MAAPNSDNQDRSRLYKFTKVLTLKVAQIVVQSRQGKKISYDNSCKPPENGLSCSPNLQWFNLSIPDEPDIDYDTKHVLNGEVVTALNKILCIEISLKTMDGDEMVLELWTVKMTPETEANMISASAIYYRMGIMLKSTLSISRITPAYKMSRAQNRESYKIFHKIYGGKPNSTLLGENYKTYNISELHTPIGTITIDVLYRTQMAILSDDKPKFIENIKDVKTDSDIMVKSDHFPRDSPRKNYNDKKQLDLNKPLTAGAFVDVDEIKELHDTLSLQLPPEPPLSWMLEEKEKSENKESLSSTSEKGDSAEAASTTALACYSAPHPPSKAIEMPMASKYTSLLEFPFADGSPITELANFYQECLQARSVSDEWTDIVPVRALRPDPAAVSDQIKMFEDEAPEFDNMVASMFSNSEQDSDS